MNRPHLMQQALGADWSRLPPALQAHHRSGTTTDRGHLDIHYPRAMQPVLNAMRFLGALVHRREDGVATTVVKQTVDGCQHWRRTLAYADGQVLRFNSVWIGTDHGHLIEFVNTVLGLEMAPFMVGQQLHYRGLRFIVQLGPWRLPIPEWLVLGHTTIVETAVDEHHFDMDFRVTHPWFGEVFRYAGRFEADVRQQSPV